MTICQLGHDHYWRARPPALRGSHDEAAWPCRPVPLGLGLTIVECGGWAVLATAYAARSDQGLAGPVAVAAWIATSALEEALRASAATAT